MTADKRAIADVSTTPDDYGRTYYTDAHLGGEGDYDWGSEHWRDFFTGVAERIVGLVEPRTVLDVGCAKGMLVQALANLGVDARGSDISQYAVENAHPSVRQRLSVTSATEPITERYDLITCIEVLEHMSASQAQQAIDSMCGATDRILFSSTPRDFDESTHINVQRTAQWAAWFAERGFYRRTDADASFLTPWAVLFERDDPSKRTIVERYEEQFAPLNEELLEKRHALLEANRQIEALQQVPREVAHNDASILSRHAALVARDNVIGLEAQIGTLENQLAELRQRLKTMRARLQDRDREIADLRSSRSWRVGRALLRPAAWLKR